MNGKVDFENDAPTMEPKDFLSTLPRSSTRDDKQLAASRVGCDVRPNATASGVLRTEHNPKTCKVHRCGLCAVAKEK